MKLYRLAQEYQHALDVLSDMEELTPDEISDSLATLSGELELKVLNCAKYLKGIEAEASAMRDAEKDMAARRRFLEAKALKFREYILDNMAKCGMARVKDAEIYVSVTGGREVAVVDDVNALPDIFVRVTREANKTDILAALKNGDDVPGARIAQGKPGLRIG